MFKLREGHFKQTSETDVFSTVRKRERGVYQVESNGIITSLLVDICKRNGIKHLRVDAETVKFQPTEEQRETLKNNFVEVAELMVFFFEEKSQ